MSKNKDDRRRRRRRPPTHTMPIGWERARAIFDDPEPPEEIWERQFDYADDALQRLARTPYREIKFSELGHYYMDLAYVELQPEVFHYLFPVCLMEWHSTLMEDKDCHHGESEFHYSMIRGNILEKMTTPQERMQILEFLRDSFLSRLDVQRGLVLGVLLEGLNATCSWSWIYRFNSLGFVMPSVDMFWKPWWSLDTLGRAVAALQYCSGLMYFPGESPLLSDWLKQHDGFGPCLWENDSGNIYHSGWLQPNVDFLAATLTAEFVNDRVAAAAARLIGEPEEELAQQVRSDLPRCQELIELRVAELPKLLADTESCGWSV